MSVKIPFTDIAFETYIDEVELQRGSMEVLVEGNKYVFIIYHRGVIVN